MDCACADEDASGTELEELSRTIVGTSFFPCPLSGLTDCAVLFEFGDAEELAVGNAAALKLADIFRRRPMVKSRRYKTGCWEAIGCEVRGCADCDVQLEARFCAKQFWTDWYSTR